MADAPADENVPAGEGSAVVAAEKVFGAVLQNPVSGFWNRSRQAGEHNGYTKNHLPKRLVASPAILAARIARSNLATRRLLM